MVDDQMSRYLEFADSQPNSIPTKSLMDTKYMDNLDLDNQMLLIHTKN